MRIFFLVCIVNLAFLIGTWVMVEASAPPLDHHALIALLGNLQRVAAKRDKGSLLETRSGLLAADKSKLVAADVYQCIDLITSTSSKEKEIVDSWNRLNSLIPEETARIGGADRKVMTALVEQNYHLGWMVLGLAGINTGMMAIDCWARKKVVPRKNRTSLSRSEEHVQKNEELLLAILRANREIKRLTDDNVRLRNEEDICGLTGLPRTKVMLGKTLQLLNVDLGRKPIGVAYLDLDKFKPVNDTYGHKVGDLVLQKFAEIVVKNLRQEKDFLFRPGGEEFVVVLTDLGFEEMKRILERLLVQVMNTPVYFEAGGEQILLRSFVWEGADFSLSFSCGFCEVSESPLYDETMRRVVEARNKTVVDEGAITNALSALRDDLLRIADERAYAAKTSGRARVVGPSNEVLLRESLAARYPSFQGRTA